MMSPESARPTTGRHRAQRGFRPGLAVSVAAVLAAGIGSAVALAPQNSQVAARPAIRLAASSSAASGASSAANTGAASTGLASTGPAGTGQASTGPAGTGQASTGSVETAPHAVASNPLYPLPAAAAYPTGCPIRPAPPGYGVIPRPPKPAVAEAKVPRPVAQPKRTVDTTAATGTGIWVTIFPGSTFTVATANDVVSHAIKGHLTSIWIRTGSTHDGLYGQRALATLLPLAHAHNIKVIAWDFPTLSDPAADARRMVATLNLVEAGQQVDGVSPDVETSSEGVFLTGKRVAAYFSRVSAGAGSRPVIATVLRPTDYWWSGNYPYKAEAPYVDVFAPMIYWSCNEPGAPTAQAVDRLRTLGKPVNAIGQAFNEGAYGRRGLPSPQEVWRFLDVAKRRGAVGASLYYYEEMRGPLWAALGGYPWSTAVH